MEISNRKTHKNKSNLPYSVFICPSGGNEQMTDYRQILTDIIFERIQTIGRIFL